MTKTDMMTKGLAQLVGLAAIIELCSEPYYIMMLANNNVTYRVSIDAASMIAKMMVTLLLLRYEVVTEALALSFAQSFETGFQEKCQGKCKKYRQAIEKLLLAEGSKMVISALQSAYDQGVYGLITNLGSVVARVLFQPFEEAAFLHFSNSVKDEGREVGAGSESDVKISKGVTRGDDSEGDVMLRTLGPLVKIAVLVGSLAAAFGPGCSYLFIQLSYGDKYGLSSAPEALSIFCFYILTMATNGILESFVQAVSRGADLTRGHVALLIIGAVQMAATVGCTRRWGTSGMIASDCLGMCLRIAYCLIVIRGIFMAARKSDVRRGTSLDPKDEGERQALLNGKRSKDSEDGESKSSIRTRSKKRDTDEDKDVCAEASRSSAGFGRLLVGQFFPDLKVVLILMFDWCVSLISSALLFGRGNFSPRIARLRWNMSFGLRAVAHIGVNGILLSITLLAIFSIEKRLWRSLLEFKRKRD